MLSALHGYSPLVMYVGAIVALFLSIIWKPQIGLYYLVPLLPMQTARDWLHAFPLGEKLVDILLLGVLIGLLVHRAERQLFVSSPLNKVLLVTCFLTYVSLWQGALFLGGPLPLAIDDPRFSNWKNYVEMFFLFFIAAASIRTRRQMAIVIGPLGNRAIQQVLPRAHAVPRFLRRMLAGTFLSGALQGAQDSRLAGHRACDLAEHCSLCRHTARDDDLPGKWRVGFLGSRAR